MTTSEMLDSLNAVYTQIRADQKKEEYDDILIAAEELAYFLRSELGSILLLMEQSRTNHLYFNKTQ